MCLSVFLVTGDIVPGSGPHKCRIWRLALLGDLPCKASQAGNPCSREDIGERKWAMARNSSPSRHCSFAPECCFVSMFIVLWVCGYTRRSEDNLHRLVLSLSTKESGRLNSSHSWRTLPAESTSWSSDWVFDTKCHCVAQAGLRLEILLAFCLVRFCLVVVWLFGQYRS